MNKTKPTAADVLARVQLALQNLLRIAERVFPANESVQQHAQGPYFAFDRAVFGLGHEFRGAVLEGSAESGGSFARFEVTRRTEICVLLYYYKFSLLQNAFFSN